MADKRGESSATRKELNRNVRMAVKRFDLSGLDDETWDFLCECGADECQEWVTLKVAQYEALQRADEPILAPRHTLSSGVAGERGASWTTRRRWRRRPSTRANGRSGT